MENFVVSARKYRPHTFDSVVGQSHITTTLRNAIKSNHLAQAFLFCGPRGVGKTTCARILAKTINCQNISSETEACDQCDSCVGFNHNASFTIHELDAASNNSVDDIRNLVDQVRYPPQSGKYKIYIIDEVHMLSNSAFNAFLKTLEEPPSYAIFILATTEKHKIIPTILSRCQIFDFKRIQQDDIGQHLHKIARKERIEAEEEALQLIAQKADGSLRDALSMFDLIVTFSSDNRVTYQTTIENLHVLDYDYYFKMTDHLLTSNLAKALVTFDEILRKGFDGHNFIVGLCEHFRNLLVGKDAETVKLLEVSPSVRKKYLSQAAQSSLSFLLSALNIGSQCDLNYKNSKNQRLHVELTLMKLSHIHSVLPSHYAKGIRENPAAEPQTGLPAGALPGDKKNDAPTEPREEKPNEEVPPPSVTIPFNGAVPANENVDHPLSNGIQAAAREPLPTNGNRPLTKLKSTIGLGGLPQASSPVTGSPAAGVAEPIAGPVENRAFSGEDLRGHWEEFAKTKEALGRQNDFFILNRPLELKEEHTVWLKLENTLQLQQLNGMKAEVLAFLRQRLHNQLVQVQAEVVAQENKKMIYTSQDKFRYLAEKNPALVELQNAFGLDIDY
ncbi:MAG: DNA polymerase III subunit gamma/tau [Ferruginibacter sp.]|nr:DNA polymerase III subunit gamma/tau [Cytophagales bacterium]